MSIFGTMRSTYSPLAPALRMPVPDASQGSGQGSGRGEGGEFTSLVGSISGANASEDKTSIRSALSPQIAYQASLVGSMLDDAGRETPSSEGFGQTVDGGGDLSALDLELIAGVSAPGGDGEVGNELPVAQDFTNDRPIVDDGDDRENPIGKPVDEVTNGLVQVEAPPA